MKFLHVKFPPRKIKFQDPISVEQSFKDLLKEEIETIKEMETWLEQHS